MTASPVGSRYLTRKHSLNFSDATLRNVMADLEEKGYINQPYASAGRVPTDKGYRYYVDDIAKMGNLHKSEKNKIDHNIDLEKTTKHTDTMLKEATQILSQISQQISLILTPSLSKGIFNRIDLLSISSERLMIVITIDNGFVKTVMIELQSEVTQKDILQLTELLNEKLAGISLAEIRETISIRVPPNDTDNKLIRIFIESSKEIFNDISEGRLIVFGKDNILTNPEFERVDKVKGIIELFENKDVIVHLIESTTQNPISTNEDPIIKIRIGKENQESKLQDCSLITAKYFAGKSEGIIKDIGTITNIITHTHGLTLYISFTSDNFLNLTTDESICINGVCLTITHFYNLKQFTVDVVQETLSKTTIPLWTISKRVNLERALKPTDRLGGGWIQGHIDCTALVTHVIPLTYASEIWIKIRNEDLGLIVEKGSITIEGVNLTIAEIKDNLIKLAIIPFTWEHTTLSDLKPNHCVNVEFDILGKYFLRQWNIHKSAH
ncbi:hypothetical protein CHS0354_023958 [Potamilus streckersoni]|uniref:Lumazine-binding domain-containing protein n=1 Tax=Potamilus streckersoni TaxID=2493646 RepID=A0AAE0RZ56_9BIVA|nr:hypothetical protein CHS0354_023958 [Potamilus streckersoni]